MHRIFISVLRRTQVKGHPLSDRLQWTECGPASRALRRLFDLVSRVFWETHTWCRLRNCCRQSDRIEFGSPVLGTKSLHLSGHSDSFHSITTHHFEYSCYLKHWKNTQTHHSGSCKHARAAYERAIDSCLSQARLKRLHYTQSVLWEENSSRQQGSFSLPLFLFPRIHHGRSRAHLPLPHRHGCGAGLIAAYGHGRTAQRNTDRIHGHETYGWTDSDRRTASAWSTTISTGILLLGSAEVRRVACTEQFFAFQHFVLFFFFPACKINLLWTLFQKMRPAPSVVGAASWLRVHGDLKRCINRFRNISLWVFGFVVDEPKTAKRRNWVQALFLMTGVVRTSELCMIASGKVVLGPIAQSPRRGRALSWLSQVHGDKETKNNCQDHELDLRWSLQ